MQDHSVGHSGAGGPEVVEHLDLVTAELRRRIAGIGLAIAELREETGRLRASADDRYHAVAVLDRPLDTGPAVGVGDTLVAPQPSVIEPTIAAPEAPVATGVADVDPRVGSRVAEPVSPWSDVPVAVPAAAPATAHALEPTPPPTSVANVATSETIETLGEAVAARVPEPTLTWVPESAPMAVVSTAEVAVAVAPAAAPVVVAPVVAPTVAASAAEETAPVGHAQAANGETLAEPVPSLWADGDDEDAAAFEAFFSAEIEPEPSQRWLLSD